MPATSQSKDIYDIDVDFFDSAKDSIATTGINTCICCVVILNDGKDIFLEHRSDNFLPTIINDENVQLYLQNLAQHIHNSVPKSSITDVFLLGGDDKGRFKDIKTSIDQIRKNFIQEDNTNDKKRYFNELVSNIRFNGIPWNVSSNDPEVTGDPSITVVVDNYSPGERSMVIAQYVQKMLSWEVFVGVLIIVIPNKKAWFWIDPKIENNLQNDSDKKTKYICAVTKKFREYAQRFGAIEFNDRDETSPYNYFRNVLSRITSEPSITQQEMNEDDAHMCKARTIHESSSSSISNVI